MIEYVSVKSSQLSFCLNYRIFIFLSFFIPSSEGEKRRRKRKLVKRLRWKSHFFFYVRWKPKLPVVIGQRSRREWCIMVPSYTSSFSLVLSFVPRLVPAKGLQLPRMHCRFSLTPFHLHIDPNSSLWDQPSFFWVPQKPSRCWSRKHWPCNAFATVLSSSLHNLSSHDRRFQKVLAPSFPNQKSNVFPLDFLFFSFYKYWKAIELLESKRNTFRSLQVGLSVRPSVRGSVRGSMSLL